MISASDKRDGYERPVLVISDYMAGPLSYYLDGSVDLDPTRPAAIPTQQSRVRSISPRTEELRTADPASFVEGTEYWLAYTRPFHGDPRGSQLAELITRDGLQLYDQFPGIDLYRGRVGGQF